MSKSRVQYTPYGAHVVELGYHAAAQIRNSGRTLPTGGSGDFHLANDIRLLRQESQRFDRDNGLYHGLLNRAVDNILGEEGFQLQAQTGNRATNNKLEELWWEWGRSPEIRGLDDWRGVESLALRHLLGDGDIGAILLDGDGDGVIQAIEAERIDSRTGNVGNIFLGVETDDVGRPLRYYVCDYSDSGVLDTSTARPYDADQFVFMAVRNRFSQTRGVPAQVSNFAMFHRINDVCDSEAIAWQILSRLALTVTKEEGSGAGAMFGQIDADQTSEDAAQRMLDLGDALMFFGKPGESIKGIDRNIPSANFPNSITMFLRLMGLPLGLPLELVALDWSKTNYSSARAALLQARQVFRRWQSLMMRRWHTPIYLWKVSQWREQGLVRDTGRLFEHKWIAPAFPWVDPFKEAAAEALLNDRGYSTFSETLMSRNKDRVTFIETRKQEVLDAIQTAKEIEEQTQEKVPWQMFCGLDVNKSADMATATASTMTGMDDTATTEEPDPDRRANPHEARPQ